MELSFRNPAPTYHRLRLTGSKASGRFVFFVPLWLISSMIGLIFFNFPDFFLTHILSEEGQHPRPGLLRGLQIGSVPPTLRAQEAMTCALIDLHFISLP